MSIPLKYTAWDQKRQRLHQITILSAQYMGANCHYTGMGPTIESSLFNRTNMLSRVWYHDYLGNATAKSGIKYVLGETNSISSQGSFNISDVMGIRSLGSRLCHVSLVPPSVSRVHFHMGTRYRYSPWQPIFYNDTKPHVNPLYYENQFSAAVFCGRAGTSRLPEVLVNRNGFQRICGLIINQEVCISIVAV